MESIEKHVKDKRSLQYIKKFAVTLRKLRGVGSGGKDGGREQKRVGEEGGEGEGEGEGAGEGREEEGERRGVREDKGEVEGEVGRDRGDEDSVKDDTLVASTSSSSLPTKATGETKTQPQERDRDHLIPDDTLLVTPTPPHITTLSNTRRATVSKTTREAAKSQGIYTCTCRAAVTESYR